MRRTRLAVVVAAVGLVAGAVPCAAQRSRQTPPVTVVTGTVLGADGTTLKLAHVHLLDARGAKTIARAQVESDGRYALATTRTGMFRLEFTGVDHYSATIPLVAPTPVTIVVSARLRHYAYTDSLDKVTAVGDWNHMDFEHATPLVRQSDGRYTATVDASADTVAYELLGLEASGNRSVNGTMADRYVYDEGGDYKSVIAAKDGHATIVFDPSQLQRTPSGDLGVTFADPASAEARLYALWGDWQTERAHWQDSAMAASRRHEHGVHYDWTAFLAGRAVLLPKTHDPLLRQLVEEQIIDATAMGGKIDSLLARRILGDLPPTSPWWAYFEFGSPSRMLVAWASAHPPKAADSAQARRLPDSAAVGFTLTYIDRAVAENPDSGVKADALGQAVWLAQAGHDERRANDYFDRLATTYPNAPDLGFLKAQFSPTRLWQVGHDVPAFHFAALDDTSVTYTPATFAGKVYLLDFWATWCGPCVREMPYLQAAHDSLASRGLEVLSISLDKSADDVRKFRAGEWKMPWLHAIAAGQWGGAALRQLEIIFIPRAILVGRDGKILAVDEGLRGDSLLPALRHALETTATP